MTTSYISRTGRVQSWMDDPTSRLPVSCTVFVVQDSMEGPDGIEASWKFVSHALRHGAGVAVHLSELRPRGQENGKGLVASGPVSFAKIYSTLNEILRRGGVYKNGAVVAHLDLDHPDVLEFITTPRHELPWNKRCVNFPWSSSFSRVRFSNSLPSPRWTKIVIAVVAVAIVATRSGVSRPYLDSVVVSA